MDQSANPKQQLVERLKTANNILVTVSRNPSVDQLAACIGLTLVLNKLGKHATAVFSGQVPSTIEFLQPEDTIEKNTDSLRDFIIALDKSKADKLRYKVEDTVVKIFITPYRTSLSADDLEFSQGDFNVDAVVALGVKEQQDLDEAITAHGRILHDAVVATVNTTPDGGLGSINWHDGTASSLSELVVDVVRDLGADLLDSQVATALLTGIVAETNRFSNEKTTPQTMSVSAELMSSGANQQLVASQLGDLAAERPSKDSSNNDDSGKPSKQVSDPPKKPDDGTLEITHPHGEEVPSTDVEVTNETSSEERPTSETPADNKALEPIADAPADKENSEDDTKLPSPSEVRPSRLITEPPMLGGTLTASSTPDTDIEASTDPLSLSQKKDDQPILTHSEPAGQPTVPPVLQPAPAGWTPPLPSEEDSPEPSLSLPQPTDVIGNSVPDGATASDSVAVDPKQQNETLTQLEEEVQSPHLQTPDLDTARNEVMDAINSAPPTSPPEPVQALNAQPIELSPPAEQPSIEFDPQAFGVINDPDVPAAPEPPATSPLPNITDTSTPSLPPLPLNPSAPASEPTVADPSIPPVPPPLPPSVYAPPTNISGPQ